MTFDCVCILDAVYREGLAGAASNDGIHDGQVYERQRYRADFWSLVVIAGSQQDRCCLLSFFFINFLLSLLGFHLAGICR